MNAPNQQRGTFRTPVGRILWGSLYDRNMEDFDGNPLKPLSDNKPHPGFLEIGVAFPKNPGEHWASTPWGKIVWDQGHRDHPHSAPRDDFSWKVIDGDSTKPGKPYRGQPGKAPCEKEGYPGHWVVSLRTMLDITIVNATGSAYILEPNAVMPGDCVQVFASVQGNTGATPGVYINPEVVSFQGLHVKGRIVANRPDPTKLGFGQDPRPAYVTDMPAGGSALPPATPGSPGAPPPPAGAAAGSSPPPPPPPPKVAVQPSTSFVAGAGAPPPPPSGSAPPPPPPPPPPSGPRMAAKAAGVSYQQFLANGWTDETLKANGYFE